MTAPALATRKRGRPVGSKDSYQRVRRGVGEPKTALRLPRVGLLRLVPPSEPAPMPEPTPTVVEAAEAPPAPSPSQRVGTRTNLAQALRDDIWAYCAATNYSPWKALIAMARSAETPIEIRFMCHREIAAYLLPKLKALALTGQVDHHHTSQPLQELFAVLEQEEAAERASLPPWTPPVLEALGRTPRADGMLGLEDGEDDEEI